MGGLWWEWPNKRETTVRKQGITLVRWQKGTIFALKNGFQIK